MINNIDEKEKEALEAENLVDEETTEEFDVDSLGADDEDSEGASDEE